MVMALPMEVMTSTDPNISVDSDRDGVSIKEKEIRTNPENPDTDGDGSNDGEELFEEQILEMLIVMMMESLIVKMTFH